MAADVFLDLQMDFTVAECVNKRIPLRNTQMPANALGQLPGRTAAEYLHAVGEIHDAAPFLSGWKQAHS